MDYDEPTSHLSPALGSRPVNGGRGVFAKRRIRAGEVLAVWGGEVMPERRFNQLPPERQRISVQIEEDLYLAPAVEGPAEWVNHSCHPNAGVLGQVSLVAMRDIEVGEEVCYDYAMSDGSPYDEFTCHCGAPQCRGRVTGNDWRIPELWERYRGYFSPYLQRRIDHLRQHQTAVVHAMPGAVRLARGRTGTGTRGRR
jgi:hypothetical protein